MYSRELREFREKLEKVVKAPKFDLPPVCDPDTGETIENRFHLTVGRWQAIFEYSEEENIVFADTFSELRFGDALRQKKRLDFLRFKRSRKGKK